MTTPLEELFSHVGSRQSEWRKRPPKRARLHRRVRLIVLGSQ